jgi:MYXO-CTERM domain-containing protein
LGDADGELAFYALPADTESLPPDAIGLYGWRSDTATAYSTDMSLQIEGLTRDPDPLAYVWQSPVDIAFPLASYLPRVLADAGPDLCVTEEWLGEGAEIALDATGSRATDATIVSWEWTSPQGDASGQSATLRLPEGVHRVELVVTTSGGHTARDVLVVQVSAGEMRPEADDLGTDMPDIGMDASDGGSDAPDSTADASDAGMDAPDSGTDAPDSGTDAPDSGTDAPDSGTDAPDAGVDALDTGGGLLGTGMSGDDGCGCRTGSPRGSAWMFLVALLLVAINHRAIRLEPGGPS